MKNKTEKYKLAEPQDVRPLAVDTKTAAAMLSMAPGTLENMRYAKGPYRGPRYAKIGKKLVYPVAELERFVAEHIVEL